MAEGKFCILLRCIQEKNRHLTSFSAVMEHSATNLKAAVFACVVILSTALPIKCGPSQYTVFDPQNEEKIVMCQDCPTCPRGEGVPVQCGSRVPNGTSTQCKPCEHGKTYSNTVDSSTCLSCNECGKKTVLQQCNLFENRKCGDCLEKHFLEPHLNDCVECFTCCSDVPDNERMDQCGKVGLPKSEWCEANEKNKLCAKLNARKSNKENETLSSTSLIGVDKTLASTTSSLFESSGSNYSTISRNPTDLVTEVETSVKRDPVKIGIATSFSVLLALLVVGFIMYKRWLATRTHSSNRDVRYVGVETENHQQQMTNMKIENIPEDLVISDIEKLHCRTDDNNDVMIFHIQKKLDIPETHERKTWRSVGLALKMDPDILDGILSKELTTLSALEHFKTLGNQQPKLREFVRALIGCERKDLASVICNWPYENN